MKKLFMFYLGGRAKGANIELHDVFFGIGETYEECYPHIKKHWFGESKGLHVDCYTSIDHIDGHDIIVEKCNENKTQESKKLFFLNLGFYQTDCFEEKHSFKMVVAETVAQAKLKAKSLIENSEKVSLIHTDNAVEVDDILIPSDLINADYSLKLVPSKTVKNIHYTHGYFLVD
jgi:hypothetical protein